MTEPAAIFAPACRLHRWRDEAMTAFATAEPAKHTVAARLFWFGGPATEAAHLAGLHAVTMQAWVGARMGAQLESMGLTVTAGVTSISCYLDLRGPRDQVRAGLRRAAAGLAEAEIDEAAFRKARALTLYQIEKRAHDAKLLAGEAFRAAYAPSLGRPPEGTLDGVRRLRRVDSTAAAYGLLRRRLHLLVAGDPELEGYLSEVNALVRHVSPTLEATAAEPWLAPKPPALVPLEKAPGRPGYLLWGTFFPASGAADHAVAELATHMLGGWPAARWNLLLREKLGLTYGATAATSSAMLGSQVHCTSQVGMSLAGNALEKTSDLVLELAAGFVEHGPDPAELRLAAVQLLRSEAHFHDSTRNLMARTASFLQAGLGPDFAEQRMIAMRDIHADCFSARLRELMCRTTLVTVAV